MNIREEILEIAKRMYNKGLVAGTSGNISMRNPNKKNSYFITASSVPYYDMTIEDIVEIDENGVPYIKTKKPSSEWKLHIEIYKKYEKYNAIVHTHSSYATAFAVSRESIPKILVEMDYSIDVVPFKNAGSIELAYATLPYLENKNVCLLANHGTLSCGFNMKEAYISAEYIEDAAKIYYFAKTASKAYIIE